MKASVRTIYNITYIFLIMLAATACGKRDHFTIECRTSPDLQRMIMFTYSDHKGVQQQIQPLTDGKAVMKGSCATLTLVSVGLADGTPIADCIVENGDRVKVSFKLDAEGSGSFSDISIKGSKPSSRLLEFEEENDSVITLGYGEELNRVVTDYVTANPDDPVSTVLLLRYFDARDNEMSADSLMMRLAPKARPATLLQNYGAITSGQLATEAGERIYAFSVFTATDSFMMLRPNDRRQTLFAFTSQGRERRKQVDSLRHLQGISDSLRLRVVEISLAGDSAKWRREIAGDSAKWLQAWVPGNVSAPSLRRLAVPRQPFYILIDSTGNQLYRGSDFAKVTPEAVRNLTPHKKKK